MSLPNETIDILDKLWERGLTQVITYSCDDCDKWLRKRGYLVAIHGQVGGGFVINANRGNCMVHQIHGKTLKGTYINVILAVEIKDN